MRESLIPKDPEARTEYLLRRQRRYNHESVGGGKHYKKYYEKATMDYEAMGCVIDHMGRPRYPEARTHICELCGSDFRTLMPAQHCCPACQQSPDFYHRWLEKHPLKMSSWNSVEDMMERRRG